MNIQQVDSFSTLPLVITKNIIDKLGKTAESRFLLSSKSYYVKVKLWSSKRVEAVLRKFFSDLGEADRCPTRHFYGRAVLAAENSAYLQPAALIFKAVASGDLKLLKPLPVCATKLHFLNFFCGNVSFPLSLHLNSFKAIRKNSDTILTPLKNSQVTQLVKTLRAERSEFDQLALRRCLVLFPVLTTLKITTHLFGLKLDQAEPYRALTALSLFRISSGQDLEQLLKFFPNLERIKVRHFEKLTLTTTTPYYPLKKFQIVSTKEANGGELRALFPNAVIQKQLESSPYVVFSNVNGDLVKNKKPKKNLDRPFLALLPSG